MSGRFAVKRIAATIASVVPPAKSSVPIGGIVGPAEGPVLRANILNRAVLRTARGDGRQSKAVEVDTE